MELAVLQSLDSGLLRSAADVAVVAGSVVLMLMLVALGTYAYKHLRGDGVTWPDEQAEAAQGEDDSVTRGGKDDEWKYY